MNLQEKIYLEAITLAYQGKEYSHLIADLDPHMTLMLKHYVLSLPEELAQKTIYGRVAWRSRENVPKGRGRPRK